ncbi:MAG: carbohydrate ABC transporter permease [Homoserinimonas sp.]|nr:carbohydrate ABC transporter permease [Homoserinimonas sp.]MCW5944273.1 carbohydrate ABC transporter permease [Cryobacterium sp.]
MRFSNQVAPVARGRRGGISVLPRKFVLHSLLIISSLLMLFPFIWALSTSLKEAKDVFDPSGGVIPNPISFDAYVNVFTKIAFSQYFLNSVIVTVLIVGLNVLFDTLAAYAFAKLKFPGRDVIFGVLLITLMIPSQVNLVPLYRFMVWLHQVFPFLGVDTLSGIVMPTMVQVFGIFLLRQFFASIPDSVVEAARLDGAGEWRILWRMIFPIAAPAIATLVIFTFLSAWNDFLWPLLISNSEASRTLPVGLTLLSRKNTVNWPETMAGSVVTIVPMIIVFLVLQRRFIEGIAAGVTK